MGEWVSEWVGESVSNWSLQPSYTSSSNSTKRSWDADYKCETTSLCQSWESGVRVLTRSDRNTRIVSLLASTCRFNNTSAETTCTHFLRSKRVILKQIHYSISRFPSVIWCSSDSDCRCCPILTEICSYNYVSLVIQNAGSWKWSYYIAYVFQESLQTFCSSD